MVWRRLADSVARHGAAALVSVHRVRGSAPREAGARMVVMPDGGFHGTIGGGRLEWEALQAAQDALAAGRGPARLIEQVLGPDLGQCCGGHVTLLIEVFGRADAEELGRLAQAEGQGGFEGLCWISDGRVVREIPSPLEGEGGPAKRGRERGLSTRAAFARPPLPVGSADHPLSPGERVVAWREQHGENPTSLLLFGAGHVGRALVLALAPLPFAIRWIDSRADAFPPYIPAHATPVRAADPPAEVVAAPPGAFVLVMTHEHALDLAVTAAALARQNLPFVGLIGSATKRARFERRFRDLGLPAQRIAALACPIGLPGIQGKEPAVIAASVAAQLCLERERQMIAAVASSLAFERRPEEIV